MSSFLTGNLIVLMSTCHSYVSKISTCAELIREQDNCGSFLDGPVNIIPIVRSKA